MIDPEQAIGKTLVVIVVALALDLAWSIFADSRKKKQDNRQMKRHVEVHYRGH